MPARQAHYAPSGTVHYCAGGDTDFLLQKNATMLDNYGEDLTIGYLPLRSDAPQLQLHFAGWNATILSSALRPSTKVHNGSR